MMKWEYVIYRLPQREKPFDELGQEGWELVSVDNGIAYFKRPSENSFAKVQEVIMAIENSISQGYKET